MEIPLRATEEMGRTLYMTELSDVLELEGFTNAILEETWG